MAFTLKQGMDYDGFDAIFQEAMSTRRPEARHASRHTSMDSAIASPKGGIYRIVTSSSMPASDTAKHCMSRLHLKTILQNLGFGDFSAHVEYELSKILDSIFPGARDVELAYVLKPACKSLHLALRDTTTRYATGFSLKK
jgi:hypothetical protein